jgi:hypothetical protein
MREAQGGLCHPSKVSGTGGSFDIETHNLMHGQVLALADNPSPNNRPSVAALVAWLSSLTRRCLVVPADISRAVAYSPSSNGGNSHSKASARTVSVVATRGRYLGLTTSPFSVSCLSS